MAKRKWYRISLSLAAKCRVGFALAVLLTIGAALFVPYRWMDRLLEQGKQELAQAEVQHMLERHFRQASNPGLSVERPPLMLGAGPDESVKPARWKELEAPTGSEGMGISVPVAEEHEGAEISVEQVIQDRPVTVWIPLPPGLGYEILAEEESAETETTAEEGIEAGQSGAGQKPGAIEARQAQEGSEASGGSVPEKAWDRLPGDDFVKRAILNFLRDPQEQVIFELREAGVSISGPELNNNPSEAAVEEESNFDVIEIPREDAGEKGPLEQLLAQGAPSRYLQAVRAQSGCLKGSCHGGGAVEKDETALEAGILPRFTEGELVGVISVILPAGQTGTTLLFNRIFIVLAGLLASIIAVVAFYLITQRFILQPVRSLREAADQVMAPTDELEGEQTLSSEAALPEDQEPWQEALAITGEIRTGDEFEHLAEAFGQMLGRLKLAHDRLRETNRALDLQLGELQAKNIALFESNKLKSEFLANVSHELRTPLNAIIGFAEIVIEQAEQRSDAKIKRYLDNILTSGRGLLSVINDLLDLAKIEAGKVEVRWELCSIKEICEALLSFTRPLAEEKQLKIRLRIDKKLDLIETDGGKLQQILFNLLSNAIKFTPKGGRVEIGAASLDGEYVRITVADTGVGIAADERDKIFEKFRQLDGSMTREHSGTGLGLAIVKELLEVLGGTIDLSSRRGGGSVFTVTLPKKRNNVDG